MNSSKRQGWVHLRRELEQWSTAGLRPTLWWRDDDANRPSPQLERLLGVSERYRVPVVIAVIPAGHAPELRTLFEGSRLIHVVQHGWAHANHARPGEKKVELGGLHKIAPMCAELARGQAQLAERFGPAFQPVLVPPWNRASEQLLPHLVELGFVAISTFGRRSQQAGIGGCGRHNCHLDLMNWRQRRFSGESQSLSELIGHLRWRRSAMGDQGEVTGILTHHLVHDEPCWAFMEDLFEESAGVVDWVVPVWRQTQGTDLV